jgi:hypothetical protein
MKRALFLLATIAVPIIANAQASAVKICDANTPTRCLSFSAADGGTLPGTAFNLPVAPAVLLFDHSAKYSFTCSAAGSAAQNIPNGKYAVRVLTADVNLNYGTTYDGGAANNSRWGSGMSWLEQLFNPDGGTTALACQSGDGGTVHLDKLQR